MPGDRRIDPLALEVDHEAQAEGDGELEAGVGDHEVSGVAGPTAALRHDTTWLQDFGGLRWQGAYALRDASFVKLSGDIALITLITILPTERPREVRPAMLFDLAFEENPSRSPEAAWRRTSGHSTFTTFP
jgi:hypothetical protein